MIARHRRGLWLLAAAAISSGCELERSDFDRTADDAEAVAEELTPTDNGSFQGKGLLRNVRTGKCLTPGPVHTGPFGDRFREARLVDCKEAEDILAYQVPDREGTKIRLRAPADAEFCLGLSLAGPDVKFIRCTRKIGKNGTQDALSGIYLKVFYGEPAAGGTFRIEALQARTACLAARGARELTDVACGAGVDRWAIDAR